MLINSVLCFLVHQRALKSFFSEDVRYRFHINPALSQDVSRDFFIAVCLLYKYEMREHTDGYTVILFLCPRSIFALCDFNIFV